MSVALVGAGPGDPGLLTLRGRELLQEADVVVYDALANPKLLEFARPEAERIYVGKVAARHALPQEEINRLLVARARENKKVVRLKGGDPYIFGRGAEEGIYLREHGIPFEEVPGITSAIAAPAYAGIPLTHRDLVSSVSIVTGHEQPGKAGSALNWQALANAGSTLVFVMGVKNLANIAASLMQAGMAETTPAALVHRGSVPAQRSLYSTLGQIAQEAEAAGFTNPSVLVIGDVVDLHGSLDWFQTRPLSGRRIVVTRARAQASELANLLSANGAEVIECPSIEIVPMPDYGRADQAIAALADYSWIIFTSVNGVDKFWDRLARMGKDARALAQNRIAAIGPATAGALERRGVRADLVPDTYVAESVAQALLARRPVDGSRILLPRAEEARAVLPEILRANGADVDVVPLYRTVRAKPDWTARDMLEKGLLDCITFGSSSTVRNFLEQVPAKSLLEHPEVMLAAIGPVTAQTLTDEGLAATVVPHEHTIPGLVDAIMAYYRERG